MAIFRTRSRRFDGDAELGKVVHAARLVKLGNSQKEIAEMMGLSASTVSRLLDRAGAENILRIEVVPPLLTALEEEMEEILTSSGVQQVRVVPDGPGRNVANLGYASALIIMNTIVSLLNTKSRSEPIRIVFSCGTTVLRVIEELAILLEAYCLRDKHSINHTLRILPSTLVSDFALDAVYPHTAVTIFWNKIRSMLDDRLKISAVAPQLPKNFYEKYERDDEARHTALTEYGLESVMQEARKADIFVLGAGTTADPSYQKVHQTLHVIVDNILSKPEDTPEILYTPIDPAGTAHRGTEEKIIGVKISECRNIKNEANRYVILVSGGHEKRVTLQTAFKNPCFNILVTDANAAEEAVRRKHEAERVLKEME